MGIFRWTYRIIKAILVVYALWNAFLRSRWLTVGVMLWRVLRRRSVRNVPTAAVLQFVNAGEPAIYRRQGWRKIISGRRDRT